MFDINASLRPESHSRKPSTFSKFEKSLASLVLCLLLLQTGVLLARPDYPLPECESQFVYSLSRSALEQEIAQTAMKVQDLSLTDFVVVDRHRGERVCQITVQFNQKTSVMYATVSYASKPTVSIQLKMSPKLAQL